MRVAAGCAWDAARRARPPWARAPQGPAQGGCQGWASASPTGEGGASRSFMLHFFMKSRVERLFFPPSRLFPYSR